MRRQFKVKEYKEWDNTIVRIEDREGYLEVQKRSLKNPRNEIVGFFGGPRFVQSGTAEALIEAAKRRFDSLEVPGVSLVLVRIWYRQGFRIHKKPTLDLYETMDHIGQGYTKMNWKRGRRLRK